MKEPKPIGEREVRWRAFDEAAALLEADMDAVDLQCETELSEEDANRVREYIRVKVVRRLRGLLTPRK